MEPIELAERLGRWSAGRGPLYLLLATRIRRLIDEGELPPETALPPDRALASVLAVGRTTVVSAYELLRAEGHIVRRQGSGTRVAGTSPRPLDHTTSSPVFLNLLEPHDGVILLACAAPDSPPPELTEAFARTIPALAATRGDIGYHPAGHLALRRAIADRYTARGAPTDPDQVLITNGGQHALSLLSRALLRPGDRVVLEATTYPGALEVFREESAVLRPLPIGLAGFQAAVRDRRPTLGYVIPTFHNPTGHVMSRLERRRLAEAAADVGVPLIDDEVRADLGFPGAETPPPLSAYAPDTITIGSLSKTVWGGLRVGWIRAAAPLVARLARLRAVHDLGGNIPSQLAAAALLPDLDAILRRCAVERKAGHDHLRGELARHLPDWDAPPVSGGHTLWVRLPRGDAASFAQTALRHRVGVLPGNGLDPVGGSKEYLRLHFLSPRAEITEAVQRLAQAWHAYRTPPNPVTGRAPLAV